LTADHFQRHENREIFINHLQEDPDSLPIGLEDAPPAVGQQLQALRQRPLPSMDFVKRRRAMIEVVTQLEKRRLRLMKVEEQIRFSESPPDLESDDLHDTIAVNNLMKQTEIYAGNRQR
jgi:hypothetical protein